MKGIVCSMHGADPRGWGLFAFEVALGSIKSQFRHYE
jgi:hypothetical protein